MSAAPPQVFVVRRPTGDPHAARRLAQAYDDFADAVTAQTATAAHILAALAPIWRGLGAGAAMVPARTLHDDGARVAHALHEAADELRGYARRLQHAHEHHGWSLGRLVAMGAMVAVGAAAVVVTVGAAAPAEAAAAAVVVEGAEAATAAAGEAGASAASGMLSASRLLAALRPLAPFVVPHLLSSAAAVGFDAVSQLLTAHRLDPHSLEVSAAVGFAGSGTGALVESRLADEATVLRRVGEAGTWAAAGTAGEYADKGHLDAADSVAYALTGLVARDVRRGTDELREWWKRER
jgi:uncharacterized protein YukE